MTTFLKNLFPAASEDRTSLEAFLDEYLRLRLLIVSVVVLISPLFVMQSSPLQAGLLLVAMGASGSHAFWSLRAGRRSPHVMLALDVTVWGSLMASASVSSLSNVGVLAILATVVVMFAQGWRTVLLLSAAFGFFTVGLLRSALSDGVSVLSQDVVVDLVGVLVTVGALVWVLHRLRSWLSRMDADRSQMVGTVSHELRNALTAMIGLTELVASGQLDEAEGRELSSLAHTQALDAAEIVEDLLTASRLEYSALTVSLAPTDVAGELEATVRRFATVSPTGPGDVLQPVRSLASGPLPMVSADPLRLRQVLRNLISNALRYGGDEVCVSAEFVDGLVRVTVSDDGDGIPPGEVESVFLPYRRSTAGHHVESVGLGLWICRELSKQMGGRLEYRRRLDAAGSEWTEFVLTLSPVAASSHPALFSGPRSLTS